MCPPLGFHMSVLNRTTSHITVLCLGTNSPFGGVARSHLSERGGGRRESSPLPPPLVASPLTRVFSLGSLHPAATQELAHRLAFKEGLNILYFCWCHDRSTQLSKYPISYQDYSVSTFQKSDWTLLSTRTWSRVVQADTNTTENTKRKEQNRKNKLDFLLLQLNVSPTLSLYNWFMVLHRFHILACVWDD